MSSLQSSTDPATGHGPATLDGYAAILVSTLVVVHVSTTKVLVVGAVQENQTSFSIDEEPNWKQMDSFCPSLPVLAFELSKKNEPRAEIGVGPLLLPQLSSPGV